MAQPTPQIWQPPRWLYPATVVWGTMLAIVAGVIGWLWDPSGTPMRYRPAADRAFPITYVLVVTPAAGVCYALLFRRLLRRPIRASTLLWIYPLAALLPPALWAVLVSLWMTVQNPGLFPVLLLLVPASFAFGFTMFPYQLLLAIGILTGLVLHGLARLEVYRAASR
jgi:hypothetical protein